MALFVPGSTFNVDATNSPDTFLEATNLTVGTVLLDGGAVSLTIAVVNDGVTDQWLTFTYSTVGGGALSAPPDHWELNQVGLDAAVAVFATAAFVQFLINGVAQTPTGVLFGGFSVMANPVPGGFGDGMGITGINIPFSAGPLPSIGTFITPWSNLNTVGIDNTLVNGYSQAVKFAPQIIPPVAVNGPMSAIIGRRTV